MTRRDFLEVTAVNGGIILKCILKKLFWNMWTAFLWLLMGTILDYSKDTDLAWHFV